MNWKTTFILKQILHGRWLLKQDDSEIQIRFSSSDGINQTQYYKYYLLVKELDLFQNQQYLHKNVAN